MSDFNLNAPNACTNEYRHDGVTVTWVYICQETAVLADKINSVKVFKTKTVKHKSKKYKLMTEEERV